MHDLVHDLAQSIMGEECVAYEVASLTNLSSRVHHISILQNFDLRFNYSIIPVKKVESLRTFLEIHPLDWNLAVLPSINSLRVLRTSSFQLSALKSLTHLRYLELYKSFITTLPESVCRLQKLQILKLESCKFLSSIHNQLIQLQDLRHLVIKDCKSLVSMPSKIGELTCLKTLSIFIVGSKPGFGLAELHDLQLGGKLHIKGLENVPNEWDARAANLIGKKELNRLYLTWGSYANSQGSGINAKRVLEALEPHRGLKSFGIKGYEGIHFSHWMRNTSIMRDLVDVILYNCKNCQQLPPLGKLPCLTTLFVSGMRDVKYIDEDLYEPANEKAFVSLKILTLRGLPNLERMLEAEGVEMLPQLYHLSISGVPKLSLPPLPSVEFLYYSGRTEELLKSLSNYHCNDDVASFSGEIVCNNMRHVKKLFIEHFDELKALPDELATLSALEELHISFCSELESFPEHVLQGLSSLQALIIYSCGELKSLSEGMEHLTCLERLEIRRCPQLVLPSNMNRLTALREVTIVGEAKNSMLLEGLEHIPSLQDLTLSDFPSLTSLPEWIGAMGSLQKLRIFSCPKLRSLPDSIQQLRNLHELHIDSCHELEKHCKSGTGKDWHKIAHVPELKLVADQWTWTFCEKIISAWKMRKQILHRHRSRYTLEDEFNNMVDVY